MVAATVRDPRTRLVCAIWGEGPFVTTRTDQGWRTYETATLQNHDRHRRDLRARVRQRREPARHRWTRRAGPVRLSDHPVSSFGGSDRGYGSRDAWRLLRERGRLDFGRAIARRRRRRAGWHGSDRHRNPRAGHSGGAGHRRRYCHFEIRNYERGITLELATDVR